MTNSPPLIIIGAGRSGTNVLRDTLTSLPGLGTWPCDEVNYVWRYGNRSRYDDEFSRTDVSPKAADFIQRAFAKQQSQNSGSLLVEKTCANSLRVGFVDEIFPQAKYVHIYRDGRDVTSSAMKRWTAPLDLKYVAQKARFIPPTDVPYYAARYLKSRLDRHQSTDDQLSSWGPRFKGMQEAVADGAELEVVCAMQWAACVTRSFEEFRSIDSERVYSVSYSEFTSDPASHLGAICSFAGREQPALALEEAARSVHSESAGAWQKRLSPEIAEKIAPIIDPVQRRFGMEEL
jgi:hypothetical protein